VHVHEASQQNESIANHSRIRHGMIDDFDDPAPVDPNSATVKDRVLKNDSEIRQPHRASLHAEAKRNEGACITLWTPDLET
jgi:hypothetical protein